MSINVVWVNLAYTGSTREVNRELGGEKVPALT